MVEYGLQAQNMDKSDKNRLVIVLVAIFFLSIVSLAACATSTTQQQTTPSGSAASPYEETLKEIERVTLEESKAAFDSNAALFLDVRRSETYATSHIPGARSIPLAEIESRIAELYPNQWIITYCT
jgi:3-mercaptopyruvate sulfurtransferase SseA